MKSIKLATLVLAGSVVWGANTTRADDRGFSCELATAWVETQNDVCLLRGVLHNEVLIGLHYGSIHTSKLIIEVLRAPTSPDKLKKLANHLVVGIDVQTEDPVTRGMRFLPVKVSESGTLEIVLESGMSPFYISTVLVKVADGSYSIQDLVRDIFGSRAIAVMSGIRR